MLPRKYYHYACLFLGLTLIISFFFYQKPSLITPNKHRHEKTVMHDSPTQSPAPRLKNQRQDQPEETTALPSHSQIRSWRKPTPIFAGILKYQNKVLTNNTDKDAFARAMDNPELMEHAQHYLIEDTELNTYDWVQEKQRVDTIFYLSLLLTDQVNSTLTERAMELSFEVIANKDYRQATNQELKRSLLGDKVDLGSYLAIYQPQSWHAFKTKEHDAKTQELIAYIDKYTQKKKAYLKSRLERELSKIKKI